MNLNILKRDKDNKLINSPINVANKSDATVIFKVFNNASIKTVWLSKNILNILMNEYYLPYFSTISLKVPSSFNALRPALNFVKRSSFLSLRTAKP